MTFPDVGLPDWRKKVDTELAGASFDKLVHEATDGLPTQPLYVEAPPSPELAALMGALASHRIRICTTASSANELATEVAGGADAIWLRWDADHDLDAVDLTKLSFVLEGGAALSRLSNAATRRGVRKEVLRFLCGTDPLAERARGRAEAAHWKQLVVDATIAADFCPHACGALVSTLPYHDAGASAADEIAIALTTGATYLGALLDAGMPKHAQTARQVAMQVSVGRDTFTEICKLRALRLCWAKVLAAAGFTNVPPLTIHAVCSQRTVAARDPWVNMLRCSTQIFAAMIGGADLVTPSTFDAQLGSRTALGRRLARNTGLLLRDESHLARVVDPAAGSYYVETQTRSLARLAWKRFQSLEAQGGLEDDVTFSELRASLEAAWLKRLRLLATRKEPLLGVSVFANLDEQRPERGSIESRGGLPVHRDDEDFERLRARAQGAEVTLVPLGPPAEHRARLDFASALFPAGGLRPTLHETTVACLCGSDERYAQEASAKARALKATGVKRVILAGRPGALEAQLREAGVDDFIYLGCDVVAVIAPILELVS